MASLYYAVTLAQPLELIMKMVKRGAVITSFVVNQAIRRQRPNVLKFLLNRGRLDLLEKALEEAHDTKNVEIVALVEERATKDCTIRKKRKQARGKVDGSSESQTKIESYAF